MSLPATPKSRAETGQIDGDGSPAQLHSILRKPNVELGRLHLSPPNLESAPSTSRSVSPKSQVRFSIPDSSYLNTDGLSDEDLQASQSPSKIVFPKESSELEENECLQASSRLSNRGHFVDMHSRVMLDVPEEIWNFHTARRERSSNHSRTRSLQATADQIHTGRHHGRRASLQAVIVETVNSLYNERVGHRDHISGNTSTYASKPELFLSPESPLNTYNMPVPLEISLPPYLSPLNKEKKRNSVIFDGEGYSQFREMSSSSSEESEESICSAEHDVSFNVSQKDDSDVDRTLGIDEHANVNLKIQKKNLKRQDQSPASLVPEKSNQSLQLLSTPYKPIHIPDLENEIQPKSTNGTLKFFDEFEPSQPLCASKPDMEEKLSPGRQRDQLDLNFTFPVAGHTDFEKIDRSPTSREFENRRTHLQRSSALGVKGHKHRRSRSIHNSEDMFAATSTPPKIPDRSPLRPKSPTSEKFVGCSKNESDSNETSSIYEEDNHNAGPISKKPEAHLEAYADIGNKTEESLKILSEREITLEDEDESESRPNENNSEHITSMYSFREPVLLPEDVETQPFGYVPVNLLSPKRSLSNIGSQSSCNSEFSGRTPSSIATSQPSEPYAQISFMNKVQGQKPHYTEPAVKSVESEKSINRQGFHSVYEVRDGKEVEVLVLDDDSQDDTLIRGANCTDKERILTRRRRSVSYEEAIKNYAQVLEMCEHTANQARSVILHLIEDVPSKNRYGNRPRPPPTVATLPVSELTSQNRTIGSNRSHFARTNYTSVQGKKVSPRAIVNNGIEMTGQFCMR